MSAPEVTTVWTNKALIDWTTKFLHGKGIEAPLREARILLGHVLQCKPIDVVARSAEEPTADEKARYRELIRRRVEGCPTAYLTGTREFYLLAFDVSPAVLIPRPDTETLVMQAIDFLKVKPDAVGLDLGTGSGCIVVSLAHQAPHARFIASDLSPDALEVAERNAAKHGVSGRIEFRRGDLFGVLAETDRFDLIVSNPPYIPPTEIAELAVEVRDHEPRIALDGGPDGLAFYRRIAADAGRHLNPGGRVLVEIGHTQADAVTSLFLQAGWAAAALTKDLAGRPRVVTASR